jgi:RHS repeat-associated protein
MTTNSHQEDPKTGSEKFILTPPSISLPKGGGAIRNIEEKFSVNPANGTASLTIPIATSPGRSGFDPDLSLSYNSGAGNGPFGLGWSLSIPAITRKTEKGLPQYQDARESDVFVLSGAEDLVPVTPQPSIPAVSGYTVKYYRPRIEGLFARIERWTDNQTGEMHWRSISKDNITTWYGKDQKSRIVDPADPTRIFSWLICESRDGKGNVIVYEYKEENDQRIDGSRVSEKNRLANKNFTNQYLKRIKYGNKVPYDNTGFFFEVVLDYGDQNYQVQDNRVTCLKDENRNIQWPVRFDPFSSCRSGFEIRTYRRCQRILMFHSFDELDPNPCLVRSTDFVYTDNLESAYSYLSSIAQTGYVWDKQSKSYRFRSLPPIEFTYSAATIGMEIRELDLKSLENLPQGIDGSVYQWMDLESEGLPGILTEQADAWYYKHNLGEGKLAPIERVAEKPSPGSFRNGKHQLVDLGGEGRSCLVQYDQPLAGYYEPKNDNGWEPFVPFRSIPNIDWNDPNLKFIDLNGDGFPDLFLAEDNVFVYHLSLAKEGYAAAAFVEKLCDEENGPALVFADATQSVYLADMSGDGLTDIVRIRNGDICYWPNLGYGRFGPKIAMDNPPYFDYADLFNHSRIRLVDIDGTGTTDIIYLGQDAIRYWFNQSGNGWSTVPLTLEMFPVVDNLSSITAIDLLGKGTACLVWSSPLPGVSQCPLKYIDLMGEKPHLLRIAKNNLGAKTQIDYAPSTKFYLRDKQNGTPWVTRLPFPVHCVENVVVKDAWRKTEFTTTYSYHHGYYDGVEREFHGFGRVEQIDVESFDKFEAGNVASPYITDDKTLYQPPVKIVTWYHTGAFLDKERILSQFDKEYFQPCQEHQLPEPDIEGQSLTTEEWREALRACKGMMLRQEVYELDIDALKADRELPVKLFSTVFHNCDIKLIQPKRTNRHAVFHVVESEAITYHYELDLRASNITPDPRIVHTLNLNIDPYGNILQSVTVVYPRIGSYSDNILTPDQNTLIHNVQNERHLTYTENRYSRKDDTFIDIDDPNDYRLRLLCETTVYELTGINPGNGFYFSLDELCGYWLSDVYQTAGAAVTEIMYHEITNPENPQKRPVEQTRTLFFAPNLQEPLDFGKFNPLAIPYETYKLALTDDLLQAVFDNKLTPGVMGNLANHAISGYLNPSEAATRFGNAAKPGQYWIRSGIAGFDADAAQHFYLPERYTDPFGNVTILNFDKYGLYIESSADPAGNTASTEEFDYRVLVPRRMKDINDNLSEVCFDLLGLPTAMALKGKGDEADNLDGFDDTLANPAIDTLMGFFTGNYDEAKAREFLGNATARYLYYFGENWGVNPSISYENHPPCACAILREKHVAQLDTNTNEQIPLQTAFEYSDGMGTVLVKKIQAEPDENSSGLRWIATGKTILNNKGKPVKQYEPYFSPNEHRFEEPDEAGVTPVMYYDAVGRLIRMELPDGSLSRVEFSPWDVTSYDPNDTVAESRWYIDRGSPKPNDSKPVDPDQQAAWFTARHAGTPSQTILDTLGREVIVIAHNRVKDPNGPYIFDGENYKDEKYLTFTKLDAEGKPLWICDARKNLVMQYTVPQMPDDSMHRSGRTLGEYDNGQNNGRNQLYVPCYDLAGNLLFQHSMDAGDRWMLNDAAGKPMYVWNNNNINIGDQNGTVVAENRIFFTTYDSLHRPKEQWLTMNTGTPQLIEQFQYGEQISGVNDSKTLNMRGQLYQHFDQSGFKAVIKCDFKGNPLEARRQLASNYTATVIGWQSGSATAGLEPEIFIQMTEYDALNRMNRLFNWHKGPGSRVAVYEPTYNQRGLLEKEDLIVRAVKKDKNDNAKGYETNNETQSATPLEKITYNAKGQREKVKYGNQTITRYFYDSETFRLAQLRTTRPGYNPAFPSRHSLLKDDQLLQNLYYTYDPAGNITEISDDAYEPVFFKNQQVDCKNQYTYDALYRLISATGRENCLNTAAPGQFEDPPVVAEFPISPQALCNYTQYFSYDPVGNINKIRNVTANNDRWSRSYEYAEYCNRLSRTWLGNNQIDAVQYLHDNHGNILNLANVAPEQFVHWDYRDMIQSINFGGGGRVYYNYDTGKERTRKVIITQNGTMRERIYLGGLEIFRKYNQSGEVEEIESVHLMEEGRRLLLVEDVLQTDSNEYSTGTHFRYQYSNHLGSAVLELDDRGEIIGYEEYHSYGTTAYRAVNKDIKAVRKRYRYTGKEWDEESGLNYHGARYYAAWLGRWTSTDPIGIRDGINSYTYVQNNPVIANDPTGMEDEKTNSTIASNPPAPNCVEQTVKAHLKQPLPDWTSPGYTPGVNKELKKLAQNADFDLLMRDLYANCSQTAASVSELESMVAKGGNQYADTRYKKSMEEAGKNDPLIRTDEQKMCQTLGLDCEDSQVKDILKVLSTSEINDNCPGGVEKTASCLMENTATALHEATHERNQGIWMNYTKHVSWMFDFSSTPEQQAKNKHNLALLRGLDETLAYEASAAFDAKVAWEIKKAAEAQAGYVGENQMDEIRKKVFMEQMQILRHEESELRNRFIDKRNHQPHKPSIWIRP